MGRCSLRVIPGPGGTVIGLRVRLAASGSRGERVRPRKVAGMTDQLLPLLDLPDVHAALDAAREAVDGALGHRALRRAGGPVAAEVGLRSAVASAELEGSG